MGEILLLKSIFSGTPYFGSAFMANCGQEHDPQIEFVVDYLLQKKHDLNVLVVGAWLGRTAFHLSKILSKKDAAWQMLCLEDFHTPVDFASKPDSIQTQMAQFYDDAKHEGVLEKLLRHNLEHCPNKDRITLKTNMLHKEIESLSDQKFDMILINGARAVPGFQEIYNCSSGLCNLGGVICGSGLILQKYQVHPAGHSHAIKYKHGLFNIFDENSGVCYYPEITEVFNKICKSYDSIDGFWALVADAGRKPLSIPKQVFPCKKELMDTEHFRIIALGKNAYIGVNNSISESALFQERLGDREIPGLVIKAESKEVILEKIKNFERKEQRKRGMLLCETEHYYLGKYGKDTYLAQSKMFMPPARIRIFDEVLGETELPPHLLKSKTLAGLKQKAARYEAVIHPRKAIMFLERYMCYNVFAIDEKMFVAMSDDLKNTRPFFHLVGEEEICPYVLHGNSLETVKIRIEEVLCRQNNTLFNKSAPREWL